MPEWSDLPHDLVTCIAKRITSLDPKSCRSAATKSNFTGDLTHQVPLVLQFLFPREKEIVTHKVKLDKNGQLITTDWIVKKQEDESDPIIELYSLKKDRIYKLNWPELSKSKVCYSSLGWPLTVSEGLKFDRLVYPFNNAEIQLLPMKQGYNLSKILHFVLSSSPCSTLDYTVMISLGSSRYLFYCKPGLGQGWNRLDLPERRHIFDLSYFKGRFYFIDHVGRVSAVFDIDHETRYYSMS